MSINFQKLFTIIFSAKFATKSTSYSSPHLKGVTPLHCKTQKTETGKILLHVTQQLLFNVHKINKYDTQ